MYLEVKNLIKHYDSAYPIIKDLTFSIKKGELISFLGESGSGKTTFLKCLAGLEKINGGSISLNSAVGGRNPEAVLKAAQLGTSFVWMPTASANFLVSKTQPEKGIRILDTEGKLTAETIEVLDIVKSYNMTLMSGCISPTETMELFTSAKALGLEKLVANHPENFLDEQLEQLVNLGAYLEFSFLSCMPLTSKISPQKLANNITKYGAQNCILTTSFGQFMNPPPSEGMRMAIASLVESGMLKENISSLIKDNPNRLVN